MNLGKIVCNVLFLFLYTTWGIGPKYTLLKLLHKGGSILIQRITIYISCDNYLLAK